MQHSSDAHDEIRRYREAVWDFMMEHCDVLPDGVIFIKFHVTDEVNFRNRVWARYRYNYHREDVEAKKKRQAEARHVNVQKKKEKRERRVAEKRQRIAVLGIEQKRREWSLWYESLRKEPFLSKLIGYIAAYTWNRKP